MNINTDNTIMAVLNHLKANEPLPKGVKILEIRDIKKEIEAMMTKAKAELESTGDDPRGAEWKIKNEIGGLYPAPNTLLESSKGKGVIALPLQIIYYELNGEKNLIKTDYRWFVFFNSSIAKMASDLVEEK